MNFHEGDTVRYGSTGSIGKVIENDLGYGKMSVEFGNGARLVYKWDCQLINHEDARTMARDEALRLLKEHGYAVQLWGKEDVHQFLDQYGESEKLDTSRYRAEITAHIMEGDDWPAMSNKYADSSQELWDMIHGTHHDHHEWFPAL